MKGKVVNMAEYDDILCNRRKHFLSNRKIEMPGYHPTQFDVAICQQLIVHSRYRLIAGKDPQKQVQTGWFFDCHSWSCIVNGVQLPEKLMIISDSSFFYNMNFISLSGFRCCFEN